MDSIIFYQNSGYFLQCQRYALRLHKNNKIELQKKTDFYIFCRCHCSQSRHSRAATTEPTTDLPSLFWQKKSSFLMHNHHHFRRKKNKNDIGPNGLNITQTFVEYFWCGVQTSFMKYIRVCILKIWKIVYLFQSYRNILRLGDRQNWGCQGCTWTPLSLGTKGWNPPWIFLFNA